MSGVPTPDTLGDAWSGETQSFSGLVDVDFDVTSDLQDAICEAQAGELSHESLIDHLKRALRLLQSRESDVIKIILHGNELASALEGSRSVGSKSNIISKTKDMVIFNLKQQLETIEHTCSRATRRLSHVVGSTDASLLELVDGVVESFDRIKLEGEFERSANQQLISSYENRLAASVPILLQKSLKMPTDVSTYQQTDPEHQTLVKQLIAITSFNADNCNKVPDLSSMVLEAIYFYSEKIKKMETEGDELSSRLQQQSEMNDLLAEREQEIRNNHKVDTDNIEILNDRLTQKDENTHLLNEDIKTLNDRLQEMKTVNHQKDEQLRKATATITELEIKISKQTENDELKAREEDLPAKLKILQTNYTALQNTAANEAETLQLQATNLNEQLKAKSAESETLATQLETIQSSHTLLQNTSTSKVEALQHRVANLDEQLKAKSAESETLTIQLETIQSSHTLLQNTSTSKVEALQHRVANLDEQLKTKAAEYQLLKESLSVEQSNITKLQNKIIDLEALKEAMKYSSPTSPTETNIDTEDLKKKLNQSEAIIEQLRLEKDSLEAQQKIVGKNTSEGIELDRVHDLELQNKSLTETIEQLVIQLKEASHSPKENAIQVDPTAVSTGSMKFQESEIENKILREKIDELEDLVESATLRALDQEESELRNILNNEPDKDVTEKIKSLEASITSITRDAAICKADCCLQVSELESTIQSVKEEHLLEISIINEKHNTELTQLQSVISNQSQSLPSIDLTNQESGDLQRSIEESLKHIQGQRVTSWGSPHNDLCLNNDAYSTDKSSEVSLELEKSMNEDPGEDITTKLAQLSDKKILQQDAVDTRSLSTSIRNKLHDSVVECSKCIHLKDQLSIMRCTLGDAIDDRNALEEDLVALKIQWNATRPVHNYESGAVALDSSTATVAVGTNPPIRQKSICSSSTDSEVSDKGIQTVVSMLRPDVLWFVRSDRISSEFGTRRRSKSAPPLSPSECVLDFDGCSVRPTIEPKSSSSSMITSSSVWSSRRGPAQAPLDALLPPGGGFSFGGLGGNACPIPLATGSSFGSLIQVSGNSPNFTSHSLLGRDTTPPYGYINNFTYTPDSTAPSSPEMSLKWIPAAATSPKKNYFGRQRQPMLDLVLPPAPERHRFVKRPGQSSPRCNGREEELIDQLSIPQTESVVIGDGCSTQAYTMSPSDTSESFSPPMSPAGRRAFFNRNLMNNSPAPISLSPSHSNRMVFHRNIQRISIGVQTNHIEEQHIADDDLRYSGGEENDT